MLRNKITISQNKTPYILITLLVICYFVFILDLINRGILLTKEAMNIITISIGWIVAVIIVFIQLHKTQEDNLNIKREEIRKLLEREAIKEINKAMTNLSDILSRVSVYYLTLPSVLEDYIKYQKSIHFSKTEIVSEIRNHIIELWGGDKEFILSNETNEIAVVKFVHSRKYIQFRVEDVIELIENLKDYFAKTESLKILSEKGQLQVKDWCENIHNKALDIASYLFDYRIELINSLLGEIFSSKVPRRKPRDPKCKILTEVAIKEEVEKEEEERGKRAMGYRND